MRALLVTALAAATIAFAGIPMFIHPGTAYSGIHLHFTGAPVQPRIIDVYRGSPAYRAGLRSGDTVSCLSIATARLLFAGDIDHVNPGYLAGTPVTLCARRNGRWARIAFLPDPRPPAENLYVNDGLAALRLASYALFLFFAVFIVLARPTRATWTFFAYALAALPSAAILQNLTVVPPTLFALILWLCEFGLSIQYGLLMQFAVLVPNERPPSGWRSQLYRLAVAITVMLAFFAVIRCIPALAVTPWFVRAVSGTAATLVLITVAARLAVMEHDERGRFGWAAFAIAWAVMIDFLRQTAVTPSVWGGSFLALTLVLTPITLMYAILKRHVIDVSFAISRTLVYAAITSLVVVAVAIVDWITSTYLREARLALALEALVIIAIAFTLNRVHRRIEAAVDFILFRHKYNAETFLNRLGRSLIGATHEETVDRALVRDPYQRLHLMMSALFRKTGEKFILCSAGGYETASTAAFESDSDLVRFLSIENARVNLADLTENPFGRASVAIPIHQGPEMTGFVVYGVHRDGTALDPDELETLERLCDAAAQAYTYIEVSRYRAERLSRA